MQQALEIFCGFSNYTLHLCTPGQGRREPAGKLHFPRPNNACKRAPAADGQEMISHLLRPCILVSVYTSLYRRLFPTSWMDLAGPTTEESSRSCNYCIPLVVQYAVLPPSLSFNRHGIYRNRHVKAMSQARTPSRETPISSPSQPIFTLFE